MACLQMLLATLLFSQAKAALGEVNVYDQPMSNCGGDHPSGCTYMAYDMGAHEVCVTSLPDQFSIATGQGGWSQMYTGKPWCICIWAYSNYILQNKDLALKCDSIPSTVLEEQYSLDKFKQCGSMSSTEGCGAEDIRRSIQTLCQQCDSQATDAASRASLKAKCNAILAVAPAAPMRLYEDDSQTTGVRYLWNLGRTSPLIMGMSGLAVATVSMLTIAYMLTSHRNTNDRQEEVVEEDCRASSKKCFGDVESDEPLLRKP